MGPNMKRTPDGLSCAPRALLAAVIASNLACAPESDGPIREGERDLFTLYVLGGSTALGEPYHPRADFWRIASWFLGGEIAGRPIEVVNRGGAGKPSADVVEDARALAAAPPAPGTAAALLYLGNNEFLRFDERHDLERNERALFDAPLLAPVARATVLETYAKNIAAIFEALQGAGIPFVASTVAVNLKDWDPNRSVLADPTHEPVMKRLLARCEEARAAGRNEEALATFREALALEPTFALAAKYAGDCARLLGRFDDARTYYQAAVDHDGNPYRETGEQNRILRAACERFRAPCIDAVALLESSTSDGLIGFERMWDNCHPTLEGYARIALGYVEALEAAVGAKHARELDLPALERALGIDDVFRSQVLGTRGQYCYVSSELTYDPAFRLERAQLYLAEGMTLAPRSADLVCSHAILLALKKDSAGSLGEWRRAQELDPEVTRQRLRLPQVQTILQRCGVEVSPRRRPGG